MNTTDLASAIFDCQPDSLSSDALIAMSALSDNQLIRCFYCNPQTGGSVLSDYPNEKLAELFFQCNTIEDCNAVVANIYSGQPLNEAETNYVRNVVGEAIVDATIDLAKSRLIDHDKRLLAPLVATVVHDLKQYLNNFSR